LPAVASLPGACTSFGIEIGCCVRCGGTLGIIASIEVPEVIAKILAHLECMATWPRQGQVI